MKCSYYRPNGPQIRPREVLGHDQGIDLFQSYDYSSEKHGDFIANGTLTGTLSFVSGPKNDGADGVMAAKRHGRYEKGSLSISRRLVNTLYTINTTSITAQEY